MALVKCPDCGKEISSSAKTCLNCGWRKKNLAWRVIGLIISIAVIGISLLLYFRSYSDMAQAKPALLVLFIGLAGAVIFIELIRRCRPS